jgi:hypothetical protein
LSSPGRARAQGGNGYGVFARLFRIATPVLDVDGNGSLDPLTDRIVVLRYLFGFTGTALTSGAVADDCTRCDAAVIKSYLDALAEV